MIRLFLSLLILFSSLQSFGQIINATTSSVTFGVSNMMFNTVNGSFGGMAGEVIFLIDDLSSSKLEVCINTASIKTGNEKRDAHLKSKDFLEVETYPEICFESSTVVKTPSGYNAKGELSMHGIIKTVEIPFVYENNQFVGNFKVQRLDYNVGEGTGSFMVGNEIKIQIQCMMN